MSAWKKCSSCKEDIALATDYYECSVSTCNGKRTGLVFCSVPCWERHLPFAKHRDAGAIEKRSPRQLEPVAENTGTRRIVRAPATGSSTTSSSGAKSSHIPMDTLIVASKLKDYIKARADMNTSGGVLSVLSDKVRLICDQAIAEARADGRKTVMDRDFK